MKTVIIALTVLLLSINALVGCQQQVSYVTPQITGQVFDKQTEQPIEGVKAVINDQAYAVTDHQGQFKVPFTTIEYLFNKPSYQEVSSRGGASLLIYKPGYEIKSYTNAGMVFTSSTDGNKRYVDMGKIYLKPVAVGQEGQHDTHYSSLGYCQPNQSQKEIDCIALPTAKK